MHCERPVLIIAAQLMHKQRSQQVPTKWYQWSDSSLLVWEAALKELNCYYCNKLNLLEPIFMLNKVAVNSLRKHYILMWVNYSEDKQNIQFPNDATYITSHFKYLKLLDKVYKKLWMEYLRYRLICYTCLWMDIYFIGTIAIKVNVSVQNQTVISFFSFPLSSCAHQYSKQ